MSLLTVGPNSAFRSIARAMRDAGPSDTILLESGYSNETAWIRHNGMTIDGGSNSTGIVLRLGSGISSVALTGTAPIELFDNADDGNSIGISAPHRVPPHFEALLPFQVLSRVLPPLWIDRPASTNNSLMPHL